MWRRILLIALLVVVIAPIGLVAWLLLTESGLTTIAAQLDRLERFGVHIEGVAGTLRGPLSIERIEVETPTIRVIATGIEAEPLLRATVLQTASFDWMRVRSIDVALKERAEDAAEEPPGPVRFLPPWLRVLAERVDVGRTRFVTAGGVEFAADRVRGRLELTDDTLTASDLLIEAQEFAAGGTVGLEGGDVLEIDVAANGRLTLEQRPEVEFAATVRGIPRRLAIEGEIESPGDAQVALVITSDTAGWRIDGQLGAGDPDLGAWLANPPVTVRDIQLSFGLTREAFAIEAALTAPEIDDEPISITARGTYADRTLSISEALVAPHASPARLSLSGRAQFNDARPDLDVLLEWQELVWPLRTTPVIGSPDGRLMVRGALPYRIDGSAHLDVPGQPAADVALAGFIDEQRIALDALVVAGAPGTLRGRGTLEFPQPRRWQFDVQGEEIDLSPWVAQLPSRIAVTASVAGTGLDADATGTANIDALGGTLRGVQLGGSGAISRTTQGWRAQQLELRAGSNVIDLDGRVEDLVDVRWSIDAPAIEALVPDAEGRLQFSGTARGPLANPVIDARIDGAELRYAGQSLRSLSGTARIDLADESDSQVTLTATDLGGDEPTFANLELALAGRATAHRLRLETTLASAEDDPPVALLLRAEGSYEDRAWTGVIEELTARMEPDRTLFELNAPAALTASVAAAELAPLCLRVANANLCTRGSWQAEGPWTFTGDVDRLPLAVLGEMLPGRPGFGGHVTARFAAQGRGATLLEGTASLRLVDGEVEYQLVGGDLEKVEFGSGAISINVTPEHMLGEARLDASAGTFVAANLNILRQLDRPLRQHAITGTIQGRSRDTGALTLIVPELDDVDGRVEVDFAIFGTVGAPRFDGYLALREGRVELYRFSTLLEDIDFLARLQDRRIDIEGSSRLGEGTLEIDGSLVWRDLEPDGVIRLHGENLLVADSPEVRIVAAPDLEFNIGGRELLATGELVIPEARIEPRDLRTATSVSPDARLVGEDEGPGEAGAFDVRTRIRVTLGKDVTIDAAGLSGSLEGSLATRSGYSDVETGTGEIRVVDGKYEAYGQKLEIVRGRLLFDETPLSDPGLDIQAEEKLPDVTVGLNVRGTLREPRLSLYSDPSMPQNQILSYLLIGKPIDEAGGQEAATVNSAANSLALSGTGYIASQLGRQFGLEDVGIESSGEDDTSVVLGKFLSPRLFVSYGISLTESINTAKLRYTISDRWVLKVEAGEQQSADLEFKIER